MAEFPMGNPRFSLIRAVSGIINTEYRTEYLQTSARRLLQYNEFVKVGRHLYVQ